MLAASIRLVAEEGVEALSLRRVAALAGVTHAAPYAHFADKKELLAAVKAEGFRALAVELDASMQGVKTPEAQIRALGAAYVRFAREQPALFQVAFRRRLDPIEQESGDYVELGKAIFARLEHTMRERKGKPRVPARRAALLGWCMVHGLTSLWVDGPMQHVVGHDASLEDVAEELIPALLELLSSPARGRRLRGARRASSSRG